MYRILAEEYKAERPARVMCSLVDRFIKYSDAYEKKCEEIKQLNERLKEGKGNG
jgi:hypothetical protein